MFTITSITDETFKKQIKDQKELKKFVSNNIKLFMELKFSQGEQELTHKDVTKLLFGF